MIYGIIQLLYGVLKLKFNSQLSSSIEIIVVQNWNTLFIHTQLSHAKYNLIIIPIRVIELCSQYLL